MLLEKIVIRQTIVSGSVEGQVYFVNMASLPIVSAY
jgi:hypothetical protein